MPSVNVNSKIIDKIIKNSDKTDDNRIIGLLTGKVKNDKIQISDAIMTRHLKDDRGIKIHPIDIARIANKIIENEIEGNVVGWFHTHPGYGAFMSNVDIETQQHFNQFYPSFISLIVDPKNKEVKFFTLDKKNKVQELRSENLDILSKENKSLIFKDEITPLNQYTAPPSTPPPPSAPSSTPSTRPSISNKQLYIIVTAVILIGVILTSVFLIYAFTNTTVFNLPEIEHTPISKGEVGKEITITATVTGGEQGIQNVTVNYQWTEWSITEELVFGTESQYPARAIQHPWTAKLMLLTATESDEYAYTIPSDEVAGNIDYFITAYDNGKHSVNTRLYTITVSDFFIGTEVDEVTVNLGDEVSTIVLLKSIEDFSSTVDLRTENTPFGIQASINPDSVKVPKGGENKVNLKISASSSTGTFRGQFDLFIYGKSGKAEHMTTITVKVPSFDFEISPNSLTINKAQTAQYTIKITPSQEFTDDILFSLSGLPSEEASWQIVLKNNKLTIGDTSEYVLQIETTSRIKPETYDLTFKIEGGEIKEQINLSLTVK